MRTYDNFYRNKYLGTEFKFTWLPETCTLTSERIWLKYAYRLTAIWAGPEDFIYETRWHDKNAHIMWLLKR